MKKRWAVMMFFVGSLLGGLTGYFNRPAGANSELKTESALKNPRDRKTQAGEEAHSQKWQSLAKRVTTFSSEERASFLKQLAPADRGKALDALMSQVGPDSSDDLVTSTIDQILQPWAAEDFEAALCYCRTCANDGMRKYIFGKILETLAEEDPDRALELFAEQKTTDPSFKSNVIYTLARTRMGENANQLVNFLAKLPMNSEKSEDSEINISFREGFDFQAAADGIIAMYKANPGKNPLVLPNNLIESWATLDPDAAQAWWVKNGSFAFNTWSRLINGVERHSTYEAAAAWVVAQLEEPGAPRALMIWDLSFNGGEGVIGKINTIHRAMPDITSQDRFLTDFILAEVNPFSDTYHFTISGLSSPQARLDAFQKMAERNQPPFLEEFTEAQLQAWGITRQQVELIIKPK